MNFVQQLEECLRDLAAEARKKHPGVKEASERATLKLRHLKNAYVSAVRRANAKTTTSTSTGAETASSSSSTAEVVTEEHPTTRLFQSSEILHPFLLAANYPNASTRILEISFRAMRLLLEADAIHIPTDGIHLVRVWMIQAQVVVAYYQKLNVKEIQLQTEAVEAQQAAAAAAAAVVQSSSSSSKSSRQNYKATALGGSDFEYSRGGGGGGSNVSSTSNVAKSYSSSANATSSSSTSSSGWFSWVPSYGSSSSSSAVTTTTTSNSSITNSSTSSAMEGAGSSNCGASSSSSSAMVATKSVKNAVSSSTGQTGQSSQPVKEMEKRALEILSCLLQLLECLRQYPEFTSSSSSNSSGAGNNTSSCNAHELWTNAMALGCVWFAHALPARHMVLQAAHSTVSQILTLLFQQEQQQQPQSNTRNISKNCNKLCSQTWQDLLLLAAIPPTTSNIGSSSRRGMKLTGAFALCKIDSMSSASWNSRSGSGGGAGVGGSVSAVAPHPTLATELLVRLWRDQQQEQNKHRNHEAGAAASMTMIRLLPQDIQTRTFHVTAQLLDQTKTCTVERAHRILQWTTLLLQAQCNSHTSENRNHNDDSDNSSSTSNADECLLTPHPQECREILGRHLLQPTIALATEACRSHHDFEDGYIYSIYVSTSTSDNASNNNSTSASNSNAAAAAAAAVVTSDSEMTLLLRETSSHGRLVQLSSSSLHHQQAGNGGSHTAGGAGGNGFIFASHFPAPIVWKAGLALEAIYRILEKDPVDFMAVLLGDRPTIGALTETLSDFATIGASCRDHMLQLVDFCQRSTPNYTHLLSSAEAAATASQNASCSLNPTLVRKVDQAIAAGTTAAMFSNASSTSLSSSHERKNSSGTSSSSSVSSFSSSTSLVLGEILWIALQGILRIIESLPFAPSNVADDVLDETFAPAMSVLQHYLKRFVGSDYLVELSLRGYASLAQTCLTRIPASPVFRTKNAMQRKALLTSLCKLSVPFWGKHDASCQLQDHHLRCLLCMIRIVHTHHESIQSEWEVILWTFEDLSMLAIASPLLSDQAYHSALAISTVFQRFAAFSTCFSIESLLAMVQALTEIVKVKMEDRDVLGDSDTVLPERVTASSTAAANAASAVDSSNDGRTGSGGGNESISKQIMNMGVRAIYGQHHGESTSDGSGSATGMGASVEQRTRNTFYEDYRRDLVERISKAESTVRVASVGRLPFALALLADVAMANSFRYFECGERVTGLLSQLAASSPPVRPFLMDTIALVTMTHISDGSGDIGRSSSSPAAPFIGPGKIVFVNPMQSQLLAVERVQGEDEEDGDHDKLKHLDKRRAVVPQADLLAPLCESIKSTDKADVAEAALGTLHAVLESAGHNLTGEVWVIVIKAITSLSGDPCYSVDRSSPKWSKCCLNAFRCLKLIVDDFLDQLPKASKADIDEDNDDSDALQGEEEVTTAQACLLDCCSSFGSSRHDVNTSLTAIGLLWTLADQDAGTDSIDRALSKLVFLASDSRPEVRNAAVNTLFSCIVGRGSTFSGDRWESCIMETVFAVYENVTARAKSDGEEEEDRNTSTGGQSGSSSTPSRYKVNMHHTRDNANKQWFATQVVVLRGLSRVLRNFFPQLLDTTDTPRDDDKVDHGNSEEEDDGDVPWFQDAWVQILDFAYEAAAQSGERETLDTRSIGVELLVLCCQLSSRAGIQAAPARVGTNMQVINGALRSVGESKVSTKESYKRSHSTVTEMSRANLYLEAFESLESYQEFLEKTAKEVEKVDDTQLQILHKFCSGLTQLYECCQCSELSADNRLRSLTLLNSSVNGIARELHEEDMDRRFVSLVATVMRLSTRDTTARFLNQAQRSALELLKAMAADGSCESYLHLVDFSGKTFYVRTESEKDDTDHGEHVEVHDLVGLEASVAVSKGVASNAVSDECRIFVLYQVLSILSSINASDDKQANRPYYKRILPIVTCGLDGASALEKVFDLETDEGQQALLLIDAVWDKFCSSLSKMMAPVPIHKEMTKISRVSDLLDIVSTAVTRSSERHSQELCAVLAAGARECLEVARLHQDYAEEHSNDIAPKSKKHRDEVLKLFSACFSGTCTLRPGDALLKSIGQQVLAKAVEAVSSKRTVEMTVEVEASLQICKIIRENERMESLVISVFPLLCQLIASDVAQLRQAVSAVFLAVNVSELLQTAQARYEEAERRAQEAEDDVPSLKLTVKKLQLRNEQLERDNAVLEASTV